MTTDLWGRRDGRDIFRCRDTGALFFPREDLREETYQQYYPYLAGFDKQRFDWELRIRRGKFRKQLRLMETLAPGKRLADIGAGPGYFCRVAVDEGWDATGIEVSAEAVKHGREQYGVRYETLEDIPDGTLDAVTCHHVLEHLAMPNDLLKVLNRKLRRGGLLVLHVPHQQPLTFLVRERLRRLFLPKRDAFCTLYGDIHISGFDATSLSRVVERSGFKAHFVRTAGMWSKYYDPFFTMNYVRPGDWRTLVRKAMRHAFESVGNLVSRGDWVIGYFFKL